MRWPALPLGVSILSTIIVTCAIATSDDLASTDSWSFHDHETGRELSLDEIARKFTKRTAGGIHLPIVRQQAPRSLRRRGDTTSAIGLGNYIDVSYSVLLTVGGVTAPLILDTGSSDLWILSDACTSGCGSNVPLYPQRSFKSDSLDASLYYGDSTSGTSAFGEVGLDSVSLAGITLKDQYFAAINRTNTSVTRLGSSGIFGLGFPINSVLWNQVFARDNRGPSTSSITTTNSTTSTSTTTSAATATTSAARREETPINPQDIKYGNRFIPKFDFASRFPKLPDILSPPIRGRAALLRRQTSTVMLRVLESFSSIGPFLPRLVVESDLALPLFTVTLQRNTLDVGGNVGMLTIGELPPGTTVDELTWVPLRNYSYADGGVPAPPTSPREVYPIAWEVMLDDVYLDGVKLPRSNLSDPTIALSALVDTGNSLLRGPEDVVRHIYRTLSAGRSPLAGEFRCNEPHTLAFSIGGKLFPVDPRDLVQQIYVDDVRTCGPAVVATDPPERGAYLFSWSLGTPFLKSVLTAYHYGNISYPSADPARMGFKSTVPPNADELLQNAVASAARGNNFPRLSVSAPTGAPTTTTRPAGTQTASMGLGGTSISGAIGTAPSISGLALALLVVFSL